MKGDIVEFAGQNQESFFVNIHGLASVSGKGNEMIGNSLLILIVLIFIPVASATAIFLYGRRSMQKITVLAVIIAAIILCLCEAYYWNLVVSKYNTTLLPGLRMILPVVIILAAILALLGINKDEKIVKSYDRLR
jgi:hypothetical protein